MLDGYDCDYCLRNEKHGGKCTISSQKRCLYFWEDPRGKLAFGKNQKVFFPMSMEIPELNVWLSDYAFVSGISTDMKFTQITPLSWVRNKKLGFMARTSFYYFKPVNISEKREPGKIIILEERRKE